MKLLRGPSTTALALICLLIALTTLPAQAARPTCQGKRATWVGSDAGDRYKGSDKVEVIVSGGGDDIIIAKGGNDIICSGPGNDFISAGKGNDVVIAGGGFDDMAYEAGKDSYDGGPDLDIVDYSREREGIVADLAKDSVVFGGTTERIKSIEALYGSNHDDVLRGDDGENYLFAEGGDDLVTGLGGRDFTAGGLGNDDLDGGTGDLNSVSYELSGTPITADMAAGTASGEGDDTFSNFNILRGSRHDDTLVGSDADDHILAEEGEDVVRAGAGNDSVYAERGEDVLEGQAGLDTLSYFFSARPVQIDMAAGTATEFEEVDHFSTFEAVYGSDYDDELLGTAGNDIIDASLGDDVVRGLGGDFDLLRGGPGDDTLDGGDGVGDLVTFSESPEAVTADLLAGTASGEGADTLVAIEALSGSPFADTLTGDLGDNHLAGLAGDDDLNGGAGFDVAHFQFSPQSIEAGLDTQTATGEGADSFSGLEGLVGSSFADLLRGDAVANVLMGALGDDEIQAGAGGDALDGGEGADLLDGGADVDRCVAGETINSCEGDASTPHPLATRAEAVAAFSAVQPGLEIVDDGVAVIREFTSRHR